MASSKSPNLYRERVPLSDGLLQKHEETILSLKPIITKTVRVSKSRTNEKSYYLISHAPEGQPVHGPLVDFLRDNNLIKKVEALQQDMVSEIINDEQEQGKKKPPNPYDYALRKSVSDLVIARLLQRASRGEDVSNQLEKEGVSEVAVDKEKISYVRKISTAAGKESVRVETDKPGLQQTVNTNLFRAVLVLAKKLHEQKKIRLPVHPHFYEKDASHSALHRYFNVKWAHM